MQITRVTQCSKITNGKKETEYRNYEIMIS